MIRHCPHQGAENSIKTRRLLRAAACLAASIDASQCSGCWALPPRGLPGGRQPPATPYIFCASYVAPLAKEEHSGLSMLYRKGEHRTAEKPPPRPIGREKGTVPFVRFPFPVLRPEEPKNWGGRFSLAADSDIGYKKLRLDTREIRVNITIE